MLRRLRPSREFPLYPEAMEARKRCCAGGARREVVVPPLGGDPMPAVGRQATGVGGNVGGPNGWVWVAASKRERTLRVPQVADVCAVSCGRLMGGPTTRLSL